MPGFFRAAFFLIILVYNCPAAFGSGRYTGIFKAELKQKRIPLFTGKINSRVLEFGFTTGDDGIPVHLESVTVFFSRQSNVDFIKTILISHHQDEPEPEQLFGESETVSAKTPIHGNMKLFPGKHVLSVGFDVKSDALLHHSFRIEKVELLFSGGKKKTIKPDEPFVYRPAQVLRAAGQEDCDTYRIPGLITTNAGTLIAVYDNRYNNSKDLQENIDVGMSRSTDGGQTWEPMQVVMDMGEWGGRPERLNGIGDPCILYDYLTGTIWIAALWMSGGTPEDMLWWTSKPGLLPEETGQLMLTSSTDDGLTWSEPINITQQVKDPNWQLMLQGPGKGITLADGTLVFPAQFKADIGKPAIDGGKYTSHSTIIFSRDGGATWETGTGAKPNTTEAQVVQLDDGTLMLNMRDDRNRIVKDTTNGRAVALTADLGKTWTIHPSSNSALPEPNCMASLIAADVEVKGKHRQVLFFSNPRNRESRINMTIQVSLDGGISWPGRFHAKLNENPGFGYSCMTLTHDGCVAILYEGNKDLYFQKIPLNELLMN